MRQAPTVVAAAAIVDRSGDSADLGVPFHALLRINLPTDDPAACPLCAQGVPVVKLGIEDDVHVVGTCAGSCRLALAPISVRN